MQIILGIDPGANGGIAILNGKNLVLKKMPETPKDLFDTLKMYQKLGDCLCIMEKLHGMPRMGGVAMFKFGKGYGYIEMALLAIGMKTIQVSPQMWMKFYSLGSKKDCKSPSEWKNKLKTKAQQLYPKNTISLWGADATLIAEFARANRLS